jgi:hypothetical protein
MRYAETLRVVNCLKWLAIVLAALYVFIVGVSATSGFFAQIRSLKSADFDIPVPALFALAAFVACILGSRFGRSISEENEDHLPVVWTLPSSRTRTLLSMVGVDALGILATFAIYLALSAVLILTFGVTKYVALPSDTPIQLARYIVEPFAFYAVLLALTASTGRAGRGLVGWYWVGGVFLGILAASPFIPNPWHAIFNVINFVNPLAYGSYTSHSGHVSVVVNGSPSALTYVGTLTPAMDVVALLILFAAGMALALVQWRRLEA